MRTKEGLKLPVWNHDAVLIGVKRAIHLLPPTMWFFLRKTFLFLLIQIGKHLPSNEADIKTDDEKVNAILTNFIKNGIKYTGEGSIEFGYKKKGNTLNSL